MRARDDSDAAWLDRLCLRYGFQDKPHLLRDLRDIRRRLSDDETAEPFLDLVSRRVGETLVPALALTSLDRLITLADDPNALVRKWFEDKEKFVELFKSMAVTPFMAQLAIGHHDAYRAISEIEFPNRLRLVEFATAMTAGLDSEKSVAAALHRFRGLWTFKIAVADLLHGRDVAATTASISHLADACLEAALNWSLARRSKVTGLPLSSQGEPCRIVALALGKLGGEELNYSSDVDLFFVYDDEGRTPRPGSSSAPEFFGRVIGDMLKIMAGAGSIPPILRVDLRLRPEGSQGPIVMSLDQTLNYYDSAGRTWERQALIKLRPCAGDLEIGDHFVRMIEPFVYRRYLSSIEIAEIQAMKRRIENRASSTGSAQSDVKTGYGGIRDIEFVVQFLQLLNGCTSPNVRQANTLKSLDLLKASGCLTPVEHQTLRRNYVFLRMTEHRLQLEEDRQTHLIPARPESRRVLAMLMGFPPRNAWESFDGPFERFQAHYVKLTEENNGVLNRLLHDAFKTDESSVADPVTDLILDPEMPSEMRERALSPFGLIDKVKAIEYLNCMAREEKAYFSTPRCRHFFAATAPKLLRAVARTPCPDKTLARIDSISRIIPVKGVFWESLNVRPAALESFVAMASENRLAADLIIARPKNWELWYRRNKEGSVDTNEITKRNRSAKMASLADLIARSREFRDENWLSIVSARPLPLSIVDIREMSREISEVAKAIVRKLADHLWEDGLNRWRSIISADADPGRWGIFSLGKLGCDSLLFHSDLDLVFVHESNQKLQMPNEKVAAEAFFQDLASRFIRSVSEVGPGFLYRVDTRLRPFGGSGTISVEADRLRAYYENGDARVWERLALLRSQPVYLQGFDEAAVRESIHARCLAGRPASDVILAGVAELRDRTRRSMGGHTDDLKRCDGGTHAIELLVQALQLMHLSKDSESAASDIDAALEQLCDLGVLSKADAGILAAAYGLYRQMDMAIRLLRNRATEHLRIDPQELPYLRRLIDRTGADAELDLPSLIDRSKSAVHEIFRRFVPSS